jgi:putative addiction module component (TIGR02574 family)
MEYPSIPDPPGFSDLSKAEQIRYLQTLWDRISQNPADIPVLESHVTLVEERLADYRRNSEQAGSAYQVLDRLRKKSQ